MCFWMLNDNEAAWNIRLVLDKAFSPCIIWDWTYFTLEQDFKIHSAYVNLIRKNGGMAMNNN